MSVHISIDLETLDTKPSAVVLSVGLAAFNPDTGAVFDTHYTQFSNLESQVERGRTISPSTVRWWMGRSEDARRTITDTDGASSMVQGLFEVREFFQKHAATLEGVWGNGSDFDNAILGSLFETYNDKQPWAYHLNRCLRTLKNFQLPDNFVEPARVGTHHHALDDAVYQAQHIMAISKALALPL